MASFEPKIPATARYAANYNDNGYLIPIDDPLATPAGVKNTGLAIVKPATDMATDEFATQVNYLETLIGTVFGVSSRNRVDRITVNYDYEP